MESGGQLKPLFSYYGGKQHVAPFLMGLVPPHHDEYVEPYFGSGTLLWQLPPSRVETINDLDGDIANLYAVLRDCDGFAELARLTVLTPWSRQLYLESVDALARKTYATDAERAWRTLVVARMSFGGKFGHGACMGPGNSCKTSTLLGTIDLLPRIHERLRRVQVECQDALLVVHRYGVDGAFMYLDPPYVLATRSGGRAYRHEMSEGQHHDLVDALLATPSMVMLSGYANPVYERLELAGWTRIDRISNSGNFRADQRTESVWLNYEPASADEPGPISRR